MFEKFLSANAETFRQRYEGTYGFYRDEQGRKILSKLSYIRDNVCVFVDSRGIEYRLYADAESNIGFEFIPPRSTYHNTAEGAVLVSRIAARQFQRGISSRNTSLYRLTDVGLTQLRMDFPNLEKVYLKTVEISSAVTLFTNQALDSFAVSKQIACAKEGNLFMYENIIGTYKRANKHFMVKLEEPGLWRGEVLDAFRHAGCSAEVS